MSTQLSNGLLGRRRRINPSVAPVNQVAPVISGTAALGQTLTASTGTWLGTLPISYSYQWKRDGVNISGATGSTRVVAVADQGTSLTVTVTAVNSAGVADATSSATAIPLPDPTFTQRGSTQNVNTSSGYTTVPFTLNNLGPDYAERYVIVGVRHHFLPTAATSATVTIGGVTATLVGTMWTASFPSAIYIAKVPTGQSVAMTIAYNSLVYGATIAWATMTDLTSMVPISAGSNGPANNTSVNVSIPEGGVAYGWWWSARGVSPGTNSWSSPMTMDLNTEPSTQLRISVGHRIATTDVPSYDVAHSFNYNGYLCAASFR